MEKKHKRQLIFRLNTQLLECINLVPSAHDLHARGVMAVIDYRPDLVCESLRGDPEGAGLAEVPRAFKMVA